MNTFFLIIFQLLLIIKLVNNQCEPSIFSNKKYFCWDILDYCKILKESKCQNENCIDCLSCKGVMRCLTCMENYKLDKNKKHCIDIVTEESRETDKSTLDNSNNQDVCNPNCLNCSSSFTNRDMNCILCIDNFYKINGTNNCFNDSILEEGFYFKNDKYYPCDKNCLTCSDEKNITSNNCLSCDNGEEGEEEGLYLLEDKNNCEYSNFSGYYLNNSDKILKRCYKSCKTCNDSYKFDNDSKIENHNCIECINNHYKLPNGAYPNNCYDRLDMGISAIDLGNCTQIIKKHYNIPENENLIIVNMESRKNQSKNNNENNNNDNSVDIGKNIQIEIYDSSGKHLNLSVCNEDIKILQYIKDVNELNIQTAIKLADKGIDVFNANDDYFNDICHENIDGKDIIIKDRRNDIYKNVSFCQKGCIYNGINYEYFAANCICNSNDLQNNSTINKTNDKNTKEKGLDFKKLKESFISNLFDFNINVIFCYNLVFNLKLLKNNIGFFCLAILLFFQIIFLIIYLVKKLKPLKIFMLIFSKFNVKATKAFTPPKKKEKSIKTYINKGNINNYAKIKNLNNNPFNKNKDLLNKKSSISKINNNKNNIIPKKENLIITNNFAPTINIQTPIINIKNNKIKADSKRKKINEKNKKFQKDKHHNMKSNSKMSLINKNSIEKDKSNIKGKNASFKNKFLNNLETLGNINKSINYNIVKLSRGDEDLLDMDYEQAINFDKRAYLKMFWGILVDNQIILGTFFTENYLHLFVIKLSFLVFNFEISLFLNAFFYTDEYISDAYHNDGVLDFFTSLPKSIYSSLVTLVITSLLKMLSNSKNELTRVIRNKRNDYNYIFFVDNKLRKLRNKLIAYFILVFLLDIFFLYYVSAFCSVYRYSQKYWFFGFLESFGFDTLVAIFICAIISLLRYISIRKKLKYFYIMSNIISTLF